MCFSFSSLSNSHIVWILWKYHGYTWKQQLKIRFLDSLFWLRLGLWWVILTWSVCMLPVGVKDWNVWISKRDLFCLFVLWLFCYQKAQTEIPVMSRYLWALIIPWRIHKHHISFHHFVFDKKKKKKSYPQTVILLSWPRPDSCWVGRISVWAFCLLCAVHL